ncbi:MAG: hypothetical protein GX756_00195 [Clostridiales bacterium]|nr:hypothetical protein [Clostridiales bacterium]
MKRLCGFLLVFMVLVFGGFFRPADKDIAVVQNAPENQNIFLKPNEFTFKTKDPRPKVYNVYESDGRLIDSFASLYQGIDFALQNLKTGAYIEKAGKKIFCRAQKPHCYFYQNGATLDDCFAWDEYAGDFNARQGAICVATSPQIPSYHSYKFLQDPPPDQDAFQIINPNLDAFFMYDLDQPLKINLSQSRIYPSFSQSVYARLGFAIYIDNCAYFNGLICDANNGNWHYCFDALDNLTPNDGQCVLTSKFQDSYFLPQDDVVLSIENIPFSIGGQKYLKNIITLKFSKNRSYVFQNVLAGDSHKTKFIAALDIQSLGVPDYMNGAKWQNIIIQKTQKDQNDETAKSNNVLIYNTAVTKLSQKKEQDICGFEYEFDPDAPAHSKKITDVQNKIDKLKNIKKADPKSIKAALKSYNSLPPSLQPLIDARILRQAQDDLYDLYKGLDKAKAIAQDLKPALEADSSYIIDNIDRIFAAWDILYNQTQEDERDNFSPYYKTQIDAYYHRALNIYTRAMRTLIAIDSITPQSPQAEILRAYEKYVILDGSQKEKILGQEKCAYFENILKKTNPQVLDAIAQILELGHCEQPDYPVVYGVNNYQKMRALINSYEALPKSQKKIIPLTSQKIYQTASQYFQTQIASLKKLKNNIQKNDKPNRKEINNWVNLYKQLDIGSKWVFKNDANFGGQECFKKFARAAASFDIEIA